MKWELEHEQDGAFVNHAEDEGRSGGNQVDLQDTSVALLITEGEKKAGREFECPVIESNAVRSASFVQWVVHDDRLLRSCPVALLLEIRLDRHRATTQSSQDRIRYARPAERKTTCGRNHPPSATRRVVPIRQVVGRGMWRRDRLPRGGASRTRTLRAFAAFGFPDPVLRFASTSWSGFGEVSRLIRAGPSLSRRVRRARESRR